MIVHIALHPWVKPRASKSDCFKYTLLLESQDDTSNIVPQTKMFFDVLRKGIAVHPRAETVLSRVSGPLPLPVVPHPESKQKKHGKHLPGLFHLSVHKKRKTFFRPHTPRWTTTEAISARAIKWKSRKQQSTCGLLNMFTNRTSTQTCVGNLQALSYTRCASGRHGRVFLVPEGIFLDVYQKYRLDQGRQFLGAWY